MGECKFKAVIQGDGINRNGRKYNLETVQTEIDKYIQNHEEEIKNALNYYELYGSDKKLNDFGIYAIPRRHESKSRSGWYLLCLNLPLKEISDVYRNFIEENKYGRITNPNGQISIPRIKCPQSNRNNIKYDSRRLFDDLGK